MLFPSHFPLTFKRLISCYEAVSAYLSPHLSLLSKLFPSSEQGRAGKSLPSLQQVNKACKRHVLKPSALPCQPRPCCCPTDPASRSLSPEVSPEKSARVSPEATPKALLTEVWQSLTTTKPSLEASDQGSHGIPVIPSTGRHSGLHLFTAQLLPVTGTADELSPSLTSLPELRSPF